MCSYCGCCDIRCGDDSPTLPEKKKVSENCPICGELLVFPRGESEYCEDCGWNSNGNGEKDCFEEDSKP
jgi:hypothetical protein